MKICSLQQQREALFKLLGLAQPELGFEICSFLHHQLTPSDPMSQSLLHTLTFALFSSKGISSSGNSPSQALWDREGLQAVTLGLLHECTSGFEAHAGAQDHSQCHGGGMPGAWFDSGPNPGLINYFLCGLK